MKLWFDGFSDLFSSMITCLEKKNTCKYSSLLWWWWYTLAFFFCDNFLWMLFSFIVCLVCLMDLRFDSSSISFTFGRKKSIALDAKNPDQNVNIFSYTQIRLLQSFFSKPFFRRIFFFFKAEFFFLFLQLIHATIQK